MTTAAPRLYSALSRWKPLQSSYRAKIMLVAFLGTHIPLLALLCFFIVSTSLSAAQALRVLVVALVATLLGTATTLYALNLLLQPLTLISHALRRYLETRQVPVLPSHFRDEVGTLMADAQQALTQLDEALRYTATYDQLTGLPNRQTLRDRLQHLLLELDAPDRGVGLLLVDLDGFRTLNHVWGHSVGDTLLRMIAQRLRAIAGAEDLIARASGDQFALVRAGRLHMTELVRLAQRTQESLSQPFEIDGQQIRLSGSIGIALAPSDADDADDLINCADAAVDLARQQGRGATHFYAGELNHQLQRRVLLESELHGALQRQELTVVYQPQIELHSGRIVGVETLLRWQHPQLGAISPAEFIPLAEVNGLIVPIGAWVMRAACQQARRWQEQGLRLTVAVNLSARQLRHLDLVREVAATLADTGLDPALLHLEITESAVMDDLDQALQTLRELRGLGVGLALDDFGTGYSSLSYLKNFPLTTLKIDRGFVRDAGSGADADAILQALVALAHSLRLEVVAEGVETEQQYTLLQTIGCDRCQGRLLGMPQSAAAIEALLAEREQQEQHLADSLA